MFPARRERRRLWLGCSTNSRQSRGLGAEPRKFWPFLRVNVADGNAASLLSGPTSGILLDGLGRHNLRDPVKKACQNLDSLIIVMFIVIKTVFTFILLSLIIIAMV